MIRHLPITLLSLLLTCVAAAGPETARIGEMLDAWHEAASKADESRYFGHFASDESIFMGTDATERWTATEFRQWARPYFERGKAWTFTPHDRHVMLHETGLVAWFDERLESEHLGDCRGTGIVVLVADDWKIAHYNLSIPVPNDLAYQVVDQIRAYKRATADSPSPQTPVSGWWRAWLETPGGQLPFMLRLERDDRDRFKASIRNGTDEIAVPTVEWRGGRLTLGFDHYDSRIDAVVDHSGRTLSGLWQKVRGEDKVAVLRFGAQAGAEDRFEDPNGFGARMQLAPQWRVSFQSSEDPAILRIEQDEQIVRATILTTTGDYGHLEGRVIDHTLHLSTFDGGHAFLFTAAPPENIPESDGIHQPEVLSGTFWSGNWWSESWTATVDRHITLPDAFSLTSIQGDDAIPDLAFADLEGKALSLDGPELTGTVRLIEIFGSWCPNCHDAAAYLEELDQRFGDDGLQIISLAFELTDDEQRNRNQVRRFIDRHDIDHHVLIAGIADKKEAARKLPMLDQLRSYPTFLFVDHEGRIRHIYTGFSGPATGEAYNQLRIEFEQRIMRMLAEARLAARRPPQ